MSNTHAHARFELNDTKIKVDVEGSERQIAELLASAMLRDDDVRAMITKALILCVVQRSEDDEKKEFDDKINDLLNKATKYQA